jgi:hypothetical protein
MTRDTDSGDAEGEFTVVRSLAVTAEDVVAALEAKRRRRAPAVLRVTPPFAGRMRARLHLAGGEGSYEGPLEPLHLDPEHLVSDTPLFPNPDETEDRLREADRYSVETHRDEHTKAVQQWRESVRDAIVDTVTVETSDGPHEVAVKRLG